ncbi:acyltransferase family protein [Staphylococcus felis]|uniref:acyltransferase family protein n=2 Tax=Staphylococcus felis TaxID=46127 RepID=UPI00248099AD|nr:acyltransferase family protein [Staphylococcus felis]
MLNFIITNIIKTITTGDIVMYQNQFISIEKNFRPEIEGLRIVAALLVAIYHIWFGRVSGGVDVFFVISGFLITTSIISKVNKNDYLSPSIYFGNLLKRLLPGVLTVLFFVSIFSFFILPRNILMKTSKEIFASLFYFENIQLAFSNTNYLDSEQMKTPVEHFWAMSIQGQFYIVWFLIFTLIVYLCHKIEIKNGFKLTNTILLLLFIISFTFSIYQTHVNQPFAYFNPLARVWQFALGGLLCLNLNKLKISSLLSNVLGWLGLIGLILTGALFDVSKMFPGYISLWPMLCATFILISGNHPSKFGVEKLLASKLLVFLGSISFGIYLWHWVILSFYKYKISDTPSFFSGIIIILFSIILSWLMTQFIEKPIRHSKIFPTKKLLYPFIANILLIVGLLSVYFISSLSTSHDDIPNNKFPGALAYNTSQNSNATAQSITNVKDDKSQAYTDGVMIYQGSQVKPKSYGDTQNYKKTILLVGGSHSSHWLGALQSFASDEHIRIIHLGKANARFSTDNEDALSTAWMKNVNQYIKKNSSTIDMVFTTANVSDVNSKEVPKGFIEEFKFVESLDIPIFAVRDTPRLKVNPIEEYEKNKTWTYDVSQILNDSSWKSDQLQKTAYYDYTKYFAPNHEFKAVRGNIFVYFDSQHITDSYSRSLGPIIKDDVIKELNKTK